MSLSPVPLLEPFLELGQTLLKCARFWAAFERIRCLPLVCGTRPVPMYFRHFFHGVFRSYPRRFL